MQTHTPLLDRGFDSNLAGMSELIASLSESLDEGEEPFIMEFTEDIER